MRSPWFAVVVAVASFACAGRPSVAPAAGGEGEPEAVRATRSEPVTPREATGRPAERPPGSLVCRTVSGGAATELFLEWSGEEGRGVLREIAPSGMVYERKVRAERHKALVIADDLHEKDLVAHAAVVAERAGKKEMKTQDRWSPCE